MTSLENLHKENTSFTPDIPGLQYAWDSTSLGSLKTCPKKYFYEIIQGYQPKGRALPLIYGIHYHSALENYDKLRAQGVPYEEAVRDTVRYCLRVQEEGEGEDKYQYLPRETGDTTRNRENLVRNVIWYLAQFENDAAETVIMRNGKPAVELTFKMEISKETPSGEQMLLCGHMDRVVDFGGDIYVMDHKTTKYSFGDSYWDSYSPNNQVSLYTLAASVVLGEKARGVIISACQLAVGFCRFARRPINRTERQTAEWFRETMKWIDIAQHFAEEQEWPMNESSCSNYGGCPFRKVCGADPSMRQRILNSDFTKRVWNPMKER